MTQETAIPLKTKKTLSRRERVRHERLLMLATIVVVLLAWGVGYFTSGTDVAPLVPNVIPGAVQVQTEGQLFVGLNAEDEIVGYAAVGSASGYGGPIEMLVGVNPAGDITGVDIVAQRESPGFFRLVEKSSLLEQYLSRPVDAPLQLDQDLDAVSGATVSAEGVAASVRTAVREIADSGLNTSLPAEEKPIQFGWPEVALIFLYASGYVGHKLRSRQWKKRVRWGTLITGMVVLGFIYTAPFTITMVVSLLSGFWPDWHSNLYWYLLIGGILFVTTVDAKNPYCSWFCPFGAFQECLATVTGVKPYRPRDLNQALKWVQRGLALTAVILGLALRRPGVASYEPFATLFDFRGTGVEWIFLTLIVLASLVTYRPFCNYLCPLDPFVDFIAAARRWAKEVWSRWRPQPKNV